jgi:hypothetical protein
MAYTTGRDVRQPCRETISFEQSAEAVLVESDRPVADGSPAYQPVTTGASGRWRRSAA